jgi:hypothetical protein
MSVTAAHEFSAVPWQSIVDIPVWAIAHHQKLFYRTLQRMCRSNDALSLFRVRRDIDGAGFRDM